MQIRAVMMFKNEDDLLAAWGAYHGQLLGFENLYMIDNGSTSERTLDAARSLERKGAVVDRSHPTQDDYRRKGPLTTDVIRAMDADDPADFYLPLDADEFVGVEDRDGHTAFNRGAVEAALGHHLGYSGTLAIQRAYDNDPNGTGLFRPSFGIGKTFFAQGACRGLDDGFHHGEAVLPERRETVLIHAHFHYKPFNLVRQHAIEKLAPYWDDFSPEGLALAWEQRVPCAHLVKHLLREDEAAYLEPFQRATLRRLDGLEDALAAVGFGMPFNTPSTK